MILHLSVDEDAPTLLSALESYRDEATTVMKENSLARVEVENAEELIERLKVAARQQTGVELE